MFGLGGIEMTAGAHRIGITAIAFFVNMESLAAGCMARDFSRYAHPVSDLGERDYLQLLQIAIIVSGTRMGVVVYT